VSWDELSEDDRKLVRDSFASGKGVCQHCGGIHLRACPRIRRIVFRKADEVAEVEFWPQSMISWPEGIIWPEDVEPEETAGGSEPGRPDAPAAVEARQGEEAEEADDQGPVQGLLALPADPPRA
jgi:hypothetical protein